VDRRSRADAKGKAALDRAFEEENLLLVYQPIHDVRSGVIVAAEALLRQRRQTGEVREAHIITDAAEKGPDVFALDSLTTRMALTAGARWQRHDVRLNVNLSSREFQEGDVVPRLRKLVSGCGIDTHRINLEITETSYIKDPEETVQGLRDLKELGVELWLDDFGTGYSTVEHLLHFPVDGLKLADTFIAGVPRQERATKITRALIALAHDLGLRVIAEGVEREEQLDFLRERECDYIQGFLFSKPMTAEEFEAMLEKPFTTKTQRTRREPL
jgi:EAL domain-containing protein (putative c-di-GMP-specific phosphodiesterase class I)